MRTGPEDATPTRVDPGGAGEAGVAAVGPGRLGDRYTLLRELGRGGMGTVYSAYDEELDRKVAIKVLRRDTLAMSGGSRVLGEAQALARLSHPNVVQVYDAGVFDGQVFVAMEYVPGETLRDWLKAAPRSWREVLAVYRQAGEGLRAAHAAGLVHRDVKPDNLMIGADGRVRVMDFGLALLGASGRAAPAEREATDAPRRLVGTPAYMAPEQLMGEVVDAAADTFALCVCLWEGLHDVRPFAGRTIGELRESLVRGVLAPPPERPSPGWLREVLARGLRTAPADRWPSMEALLDALDRGLAREAGRRRALRLGGLAIALLTLAGVGLGWRWHAEAQRVAACAALGAEIGAAWDDAARARLRAALLGSGLPFAPATAERVLPRLDAWAAEWSRVREETCLNEHVSEVWSMTLREGAEACLDERRSGFEAAIEALATGSREVVTDAVEIVGSLASARACGEPDLLARRPALSGAERERLGTVRRLLARASVALRAEPRQGEVFAREALAAAEALGWPPAQAEARLWVGRFEAALERHAAAKATLVRAYFEAARASAPEVATDAALELVEVTGRHLHQREHSQLWAQLAELGLQALGEGGRSQRDVTLLAAWGQVDVISGEHRGGAERLRRAVELAEDVLGDQHPDFASVVSRLALAEGQLGELSRARDTAARAFTLVEQTLGPDHPEVMDAARVLAARTAALAPTLDEPAAATRAYAEAVALLRRVLALDDTLQGGVDSERRAVTLAQLHFVDFLGGADLDGSEAGLRASLAMYERLFGPDSPKLMHPLGYLARVQDERGDHEAARRTHERALVLARRLGPEGRASVATVLTGLGVACLHDGALAEARASLEEAHAIRAELFEDAHPMMAQTLRALVLLELEGGSLARGESLLERAREGSSRADLAEARFALARALWRDAPQRRGEAREAAEQARAGFVVKGERGRLQRAAVEAWLAEHPLP